MRLAMIVEYEGTNYCGFQYQANSPSVQEELERSITHLTGEKVRVAGAGRTDAGVHATGQVVAFDTAVPYSPGTFVRALNHYLPDDIAVKEAYRTGNDFNPRRMAMSRRYRYTIDCDRSPSPLGRRTSYHLGRRLNIGLMQKAAAAFVGRHDFARFAGPLERPEASTVREVTVAQVTREGDIVSFEVEGNAFLPHQVRRMAGALVEVGRSSLSLDRLESMIAGEPGDEVAPSLPPQGLCLSNVRYAEFPPEDSETNGNKN